MKKILLIIITASLAACANTSGQQVNPKDIPVDTGAQPQSDVIVSAPPGTLGHGRF